MIEGVFTWLEFAWERLSDLQYRTAQHLMLVGLSISAAVLVGIPLGIVASMTAWLKRGLLSVVGIFQTIPSLAMLAILLVAMGRIGAFPAIIALTLYALLPIVRNTVTGIDGVPPEVTEAARGIGMTWFQQLWMVQLPLATPIIIAGVRTAAVVGVGIATLSAFIGAGGLGQFINRGLALSDVNLILLGAIPAAVLAILIDTIIAAAEWGLQPVRQRERGTFVEKLKPIALILPIVLLLAILVVTLFGRSSPFSGKRAGVIRIGSKNFSEQFVLGEMMAQMIEEHTDLYVDRRFNLGGTMICHWGLLQDEIDLYPEYTGTGLLAILRRPVISDPQKTFSTVQTEYRRRYDLRWMPSFGFSNSYAICIRKEQAGRAGWTKISDLKPHARELRAGFTAEFMERSDGYPGLKKAYEFDFGTVRDMGPNLMYQAVAKKEVDVISAFETDGRIQAYKLQPLKDDLGFFPPYEAAPVIRIDFLNGHPEVRDILRRLTGELDSATMRRLNFEVDEKGRSPEAVAREFLLERGLIQR